ncbi:MAG: LysE family translocator [Thermomicrobiales bacterium]|nr:LysE family translocator [Thermomicrobiales bacterium]
MDWSLFPRGLLIGLSVAIPVGPMALLCIRRTLAFGFGAGFTSGIGIASADAIYGAVAAFGLTSISSFLVDIQDIVRFGGGLFLCYLGISTFRSIAGRIEDVAASGGSRHAGAFASTLGLTLTNPATILSFAAIFSGFGIAGRSDDAGSATALVAGVFLGSSLWWLILVTGTGRLRGWLSAGRLTTVNRLSGLAIGTFGLLALLSAIR